MPRAAAAVETYARRLAKSLATVINLLDPDVIVLGGGLSNIASLYTRVPEIWTEWVFSDRVDTRLARARPWRFERRARRRLALAGWRRAALAVGQGVSASSISSLAPDRSSHPNVTR